MASAALRGGFVLLPRTLLHAPGLSRDAKLLYAVLLSYAWQRGSCFPGYARLQADLGCGDQPGHQVPAGAGGRRPGHPAPAGLGKTTLYTLHDPPARPAGRIRPPPSARPNPDPRAPESQIGDPDSQIGESGLTRPRGTNKTQGTETQQNIIRHGPGTPPPARPPIHAGAHRPTRPGSGRRR